jgi:hypothetical protein
MMQVRPRRGLSRLGRTLCVVHPGGRRSPPNVGACAYGGGVDTLQSAANNPLPLAPDDVPQRAVRAVRRALLRTDPDPGLIVALVIAALRGDGGTRALEVRVTAPGREFPLMTLAVTEAELGGALSLALGCCRDIDGFEIRVRPLGKYEPGALRNGGHLPC